MGCEGSAKLIYHGDYSMKYKMLENYPDVLTPDDVIKILNIGRNKVYEMLNNGTLRSIRIGRKHRIPKKILIEYLENS